MAFSSATVTIGHSTAKSDYDRLLDNTQYNKAARDNDVTFIGTKTFSSSTVFVTKPKMDGIETRSGTGSVALECQYLSATVNSVISLKTKVIKIGDWNMSSTNSVLVTHGVDRAKIRSINVVILRDDDYPYQFPAPSSSASTGETISFGATQLSIVRATGGTFANEFFNATSFNRGFVTIVYEE